MADQQRSEIIKNHPLGAKLGRFHTLFNSVCEEKGIPPTPDAFDQFNNTDLKILAGCLLSILETHPVAQQLPSKTNHAALQDDIRELISAVFSRHFNFECIRPLFDAVLAEKSDKEIWDQVYNAVTESPCRPQQTALSFPPPRALRPRSSFWDSSEYRGNMEHVLEREVGPVYVGLRDFHETFFGGVPGLETASEAFFETCVRDNNPLFDDGWRGWPKHANSDAMLSWLPNFCEKLIAFAENYASFSTHQRTLLAKSNELMDGDMEVRKMDIGFVNKQKAKKDRRCQWFKFLVLGAVKSSPSADGASDAWLDLGRDAKKVFYAQETRRFVLGSTLCGSLMRVWEFDHSGGTASDQFDINVDGLRFICTMLGFLWMSEEQLGYDPTIITSGKDRYIKIRRNGSEERLILDHLIVSSYSINSRATTCWKAHPEGDAKQPIVIKDAWHSTELYEEGKVFEEVTDKGAVNVARHYYHETVRVSGKVDDVNGNVRKGMDVTKAVSEISSGILGNRVHRRVILRDYGRPIYEASSPVALLTALEGCIEGHESLYRAGYLHRDISVNNLMINEDPRNSSYFSFLIDLDLAINRSRKEASGADGRTGTLAFMSIGVLRGRPHSYRDDLESFFWVLFWICIHYTGQGKEHARVVTEFEKWNYMNMVELAKLKRGNVAEDFFLDTIDAHVTPYYSVLKPCLIELREKVFPKDREWKTEDRSLYSSMKTTFCEAKEVLMASQRADGSPVF